MGSSIRSRRRSADGTVESRCRKQQRTRKQSHHRGLRIEQFEDRLLLSINPDLIAVLSHDVVYQPEPAVAPTMHVAPQQMTLRFNEGQSIDPLTLSGIQITRDGANDAFYDPVANPDDVDDVVITPGWVGLGDKGNEVIVRFAETLPDDTYRITIVGSDDYQSVDGKDVSPLMNTDDPALPFRHGTDETLAWDFTLDLGPQVVAVVPQPITRDEVTGALEQYESRNTIEVYFSAAMNSILSIHSFSSISS